jgi:hypothetical protein
MPELGHEITEVHSQLLRVTLEAEHAQAWWPVARPDLPIDDEAALAFGQYWFGAKSMARVRSLLGAFRFRFAAYPQALEALRLWTDIDRDSRNAVCHFHVQLTDPLYRAFTGEFLPERRLRGHADVGREAVLAWIGRMDRDKRWSAATRVGFASKLLSVAHGAGLVETTRDPRPLGLPKVPGRALAYLLHLLRGVRFAGRLHDNPYLRSVGLEGGVLDDRLRTVVGVELRRLGDVVELDFGHPGLLGWAHDTLERAS